MANTLPIKWIKDKTDGKFFPFTHEDAVIDENGNTISEKYAELVETKQDVISDLEDIRAGAALGATAMQPNTDEDITGIKTVNDINKLRFAIDTNKIVSTGGGSISNAIAFSPMSWNAWHDHFAFLRNAQLLSFQKTSDNVTWTDSSVSLKPLFSHKETTNIYILGTSDLASRFTLYSSWSFYASQIRWFVIGVNYTNPFSNFTLTIERSDDNTIWSTLFTGSINSVQSSFFLKSGSLDTGDPKYIRFTFTKVTNISTGTVALNSICALTQHKGNQGLGREYSYPYDWDADANVFPIANGTKNFGSTSVYWNNIYAKKFVVQNGTSSQFLKADGSVDSTGYLPLDGSVDMTGTIHRTVTAASSNTPALQVNSDNQDTWIWRVKDNATGTKTSTSSVYGFGTKYLGTGTGNNNALAICADAQNGTQVEAIKILQSGATTFAVTPSAPTQTAGTNNTTLATTAFVKTAVDNKVHYVANLQAGTAANYITEPEVKSVKINGSTTNSASSSNCILQYDTTNKCLKFVFN